MISIIFSHVNMAGPMTSPISCQYFGMYISSSTHGGARIDGGIGEY
jgi:hypothetical protein